MEGEWRVVRLRQSPYPLLSLLKFIFEFFPFPIGFLLGWFKIQVVVRKTS